MSKKLITVFGATGQQGSSVVRALVKDGHYSVRGVTRDASKPEAKKIADLGVEIVAGDVTKKEDINRVLKGAYGAFLITNFWDPSTMGKEVEIGKNLVDASKENSLKFVVWADLPNAAKISHGKYKVAHFTDKAIVGEYLALSGIPHARVAPAAYLQNFGTFIQIKKNAEGIVQFPTATPPSHKFYQCDIEATGEAVVNILNNEHTYNGKFIPLCSEENSWDELVKQFEEVTGTKAVAFKAPGFNHEMQEMNDYFTDFGYFGPNPDFTLTKKVNPSARSFKEYVKAGKIPIS